MNEYFSHDYKARSDPKLVKLVMKHGLAGLGAYWCIVEMLYETGGYILRSEYERIAYELRTEYKTIQSVIEDFKLFASKGEKFYSPTVLERMKKREERSEKARQSVYVRWAKQSKDTASHDSNTNVLPPKTKRNTIKRKRKDKIDITPSVIPLAEKIQEKNIIPPTLEMVKDYCQQRNNNINAEHFINHYTAKDWKIGKERMIDWQAAIRTWEKNNTQTSKNENYGKE